MHWQAHEAEQRFSEMLRAAEAGEPQIVTEHGAEVAVVLNIVEYRRLRGERAGLMEYLRAAPIGGATWMPIDRPGEQPRDIDLTR